MNRTMFPQHGVNTAQAFLPSQKKLMNLPQIGRYQLLVEIAAGGSVYRAHDPMLGRTVAIKVLHPHLARDPQVRERFIGEGRILAGLRHPNLVQVFDAGEADGVVFLAEEFISGRTLADYARVQRLFPGQILPIIRSDGLVTGNAPADQTGTPSVSPGSGGTTGAALLELQGSGSRMSDPFQVPERAVELCWEVSKAKADTPPFITYTVYRQADKKGMTIRQCDHEGRQCAIHTIDPGEYYINVDDASFSGCWRVSLAAVSLAAVSPAAALDLYGAGSYVSEPFKVQGQAVELCWQVSRLKADSDPFTAFTLYRRGDKKELFTQQVTREGKQCITYSLDTGEYYLDISDVLFTSRWYLSLAPVSPSAAPPGTVLDLHGSGFRRSDPFRVPGRTVDLC